MAATQLFRAALALAPMLAVAIAFGASTSKLARTPPLGFNTWNKFGCSGINGQVLKDTADLFVTLGLDKLGYVYSGLTVALDVQPFSCIL